MLGYRSPAVKLCAFVSLLTLLALAAAGCGDFDDEMTPTPAAPPPTGTPAPPDDTPTPAPMPPTSTPTPPTDTSTPTPMPPTGTPAPPADTPTPAPMPPTGTPAPPADTPTPTPMPPTGTPAPPADTPTPTPMPPTSTPIPPTSTPSPPPPVPTSTPPPAPQPTSTPEVAGVGKLDPALILLESSKAMDEVESFHFVMQATLSADQGPLSIELPMTSEGDFQRPDRSRASVDIDLGLFKIETEVIAIGDEVYMTDLESGQWIKSDGGSDLMILDPVDLTDPGEFTNQDNFSELDDLRIVGQEAIEGIEGIDTHHLAFSLPDWESDEGEPLSGDIEMHMWVGVDDYYLYKITLDGRFSLAQDETTQSGGSLIAGLGSDGDIDLDAVVNLSNFNAPVLIQPPDDFRTELPTSPAVQDVAPVQTTELDSGWMRFDLPTKGVGISAPPTWLLVPLDVEDALGMVENSFADVEGLADLVESFGDEARHSLLAVELDDDGGLTSSFNIVTEAVDPALDLNALADFSVQQIELLLPGVGEVTSEAVELPAGAAYRIGYTVSASGPTDAAAEVAVAPVPAPAQFRVHRRKFLDTGRQHRRQVPDVPGT